MVQGSCRWKKHGGARENPSIVVGLLVVVVVGGVVVVVVVVVGVIFPLSLRALLIGAETGPFSKWDFYS